MRRGLAASGLMAPSAAPLRPVSSPARPQSVRCRLQFVFLLVCLSVQLVDCASRFRSSWSDYPSLSSPSPALRFCSPPVSKLFSGCALNQGATQRRLTSGLRSVSWRVPVCRRDSPLRRLCVSVSLLGRLQAASAPASCGAPLSRGSRCLSFVGSLPTRSSHRPGGCGLHSFSAPREGLAACASRAFFGPSEAGRPVRGATPLGASKCSLLNLVDFAPMRVPPLTAEALLHREESRDAFALQVHTSLAAARKARAREEEARAREEGARLARNGVASPEYADGSGEWNFPPAAAVSALSNYHAILYYATWDSRCQALTQALADLASLACPDPTSSTPAGPAATRDGAREDASAGGKEGTSATPGAGPQEAGQSAAAEDTREGLQDILAACIPCWLPMTGVPVSNSLVIAVGRRPLQKQTRMLANKKQLRHHERALHLMISEGIFYGSGHLPALQIWRRSAAEDSAGGRMQNVGGNAGDPLRRGDSLAARLIPTTISSSRWEKVLEVRGFGPIPLMELAGGDASPWKEEESLLMTRALLKKSREGGTNHPGHEGILSAGSGGFLGGARVAAAAESDLRVWLSQLSSIYQYHAMRTLLKRLRYAEDEFPEFQEFNLRKFSPRLAKLKGLLKD
ncbi:hypothetical protein BESB_083620 [Besnoitia besnoiti]|uniref:Uncharacterized protein n=1 Tax=Besnoitia besnoiti TaxID=94643 RepID=A0A2A9MBW5_BESBE|nr:hypothetical protein BESB_083620 [Besnoitia besnoiti]PFH33163.1 hypothetical protein BESB_083620 [Besnoitia besnoiti]